MAIETSQLQALKAMGQDITDGNPMPVVCYTVHVYHE
jgi:hypothetical protein